MTRERVLETVAGFCIGSGLYYSMPLPSVLLVLVGIFMYVRVVVQTERESQRRTERERDYFRNLYYRVSGIRGSGASRVSDRQSKSDGDRIGS